MNPLVKLMGLSPVTNSYMQSMSDLANQYQQPGGLNGLFGNSMNMLQSMYTGQPIAPGEPNERAKRLMDLKNKLSNNNLLNQYRGIAGSMYNQTNTNYSNNLGNLLSPLLSQS